MEEHGQFAALAIACMDGRFRNRIDAFLTEQFGKENVDCIRVPGAAVKLSLSAADAKRTDLYEGIELAYADHGVRRILIIEHEDCGKYAKAGLVKNGLEPNEELEIHARHARAAASLLKQWFPELTIAIYYAKRDGVIIPLQ